LNKIGGILVRKVLALWIAVAVVSVGVVFAVGPGLVSGQQVPSASRSLPSDPVPAGSEFTVTITGATGYGAAGSVVETLPEGFSYVSGSSSLSPSAVDERNERTVAFQLFGGSSFTYRVTASGMEGNHSFSGVVIHFDRVTSRDVGGDETVTVEPAPVSAASRSFSPASVVVGEDVEVTINASGYGASGTVAETLPSGFTYVTSSLAAASVTESGQTVTFTLGGETSFTYTTVCPVTRSRVTASDTAGDESGQTVTFKLHAPFTGVLTDEGGMTADVSGAMGKRVSPTR
jgi:hypothetical protein